MKTKEEIIEELDKQFEIAKLYPNCEHIGIAISRNLELLAELEESEGN